MVRKLVFSAGILLFVGCGSKTATTKSEQTGSDRDAHGCIGSAGYIWSEVKQECVRLFEVGIKMSIPSDETRAAYLVFATDSARAELFMPNMTVACKRETAVTEISRWKAEVGKEVVIEQENGVWKATIDGRIICSQE